MRRQSAVLGRVDEVDGRVGGEPGRRTAFCNSADAASVARRTPGPAGRAASDRQRGCGDRAAVELRHAGSGDGDGQGIAEGDAYRACTRRVDRRRRRIAAADIPVPPCNDPRRGIRLAAQAPARTAAWADRRGLAGAVRRESSPGSGTARLSPDRERRACGGDTVVVGGGAPVCLACGVQRSGGAIVVGAPTA